MPLEEGVAPVKRPPARAARNAAEIGLDPERARTGADDDPVVIPRAQKSEVKSAPRKIAGDDPEHIRADIVNVDTDDPPIPVPVQPLAAPAAPRVLSVNDPERVRQYVERATPELDPPVAADPVPPTMKPLVASAPPAPRFDDPEQIAKNPGVSDGDDSGPQIAYVAPVSPAAPGIKPSPRQAQPLEKDETPRFVSGSGIDSNTEEAASEKILAAKRAKAEALLKKENAVADNAAAKSRVAVPKPTDPVAVRKDGKDVKKAASNSKPGAKDTKPVPPGEKGKEPQVDPQQQFDETLEKIRESKEKMEALMAEKHAKDAAAAKAGNVPEDNVRARDPRAKTALNALNSKIPLGAISGQVVDGSQKPIAARVKIIDQTNTTVNAPLPEGYFCAGQFNTRVISGPVRVEITHGRFSAACVKGIEVKPNAVTNIQVASTRPNGLNFASKGWYLADLDVGMRLRPEERRLWLGNTPELKDLILAARAEDVHILGVPVPWGEAKDKKQLEALLSSQQDMLLLPVFPGPRHAFCGCGMGLGMKSYDNLPEEIASPETPLRESFDEIRSRGGVAVFKTPNGLRNADIRRDIVSLFPQLEKSNFYHGAIGNARLYAGAELPFDTITGPAYDALSFDGSDASERLWFNLISQGYRIGVIGASGGSLEGGQIPYGQTFIHTDGRPTVKKVLDAIRQGRTCVSFGPAVFCKVLERDMGPGSVLPADGRPLTLQLQAYASMPNGSQIDTIEIIRNNEVVSSQTANEGESQIDDFRFPIVETSSAWYVVRITEKYTLGTTTYKGGKAWTSPIYFKTADDIAPAPATSLVTGTLHFGLTPVAGTVTAVVPGLPSKQVSSDNNGRFSIKLPASGTLIFEAPGCEPLAKRVFEHPKIQQALGALQCERDGSLSEQFAKPSLLPAWALLVSELDWDVSLSGARPQNGGDTKPIDSENHQ